MKNNLIIKIKIIGMIFNILVLIYWAIMQHYHYPDTWDDFLFEVRWRWIH